MWECSCTYVCMYLANGLGSGSKWPDLNCFTDCCVVTNGILSHYFLQGSVVTLYCVVCVTLML